MTTVLTATATREVVKTFKDEAGRWQSVSQGQESYTFEITADITRLYNLGARAARNKGGRSKIGPLYCKVISRRKI